MVVDEFDVRRQELGNRQGGIPARKDVGLGPVIADRLGAGRILRKVTKTPRVELQQQAVPV